MKRFLGTLDERYVLHRYKATSHAAVVGSVLLGLLFLNALVFAKAFRYDLILVLSAMAVTKLAAMLWYRRRD